MPKIYSTHAKSIIMDYLKEHGDLRFTAKDVYEDLVKRGEDVNLATIYRNIEKLTEDGSLIKTKSVDSKSSLYQYAGDKQGCHEHLHMQCKVCGKVIHLECDFMKEISKHLLDHHGFCVECEGSVIMGICEKCRKAMEK